MFPLYDFLIYCFIAAYTPGANNLLSMSNAARLGFRRSVVFNFGITAGFFFVMSLCTLFSATLYNLLPKVKIFMQVLGAIYMLYLAWKVWKSSGDLKAEGGKETSFMAGMILQFMNPKIYIYAITAMSLYILPVYSSPLVLFGCLFFSSGPFRFCFGTDRHRSLRFLCMGSVRRCLLPVLCPACKGRKPGHGPASGVLCGISFSVKIKFLERSA